MKEEEKRTIGIEITPCEPVLLKAESMDWRPDGEASRETVSRETLMKFINWLAMASAIGQVMKEAGKDGFSRDE